MKSRAQAVCLASLLAFVAGSAQAARWPGWAADAANGSYLDRLKGEDSVVVLDEWDITVSQGARSGIWRRVIHVLTKDGVGYATVILPTNHLGEFDRVRLWVHDPGGRTTKYSDEDGSLFSNVSRQILDDTEVLALIPPGVRPGTKVAVEARFKRKAELPQDMFPIQDAIPVVLSTIRVTTPEPWGVEAKIFHGNGAHRFREGQLTWQFEEVPGQAFARDEYSPQPPLAVMVLNYSAPGEPARFATWAGVRSWASAMYESSSMPDATVRKMAAGLPSELSQAVDEAGRLSRELRYFGVELGWGGFIPRPPAKTLDRAFGDCKDKTQLMVSLLASAGVPAYPALIVAPSSSYVPDEMPSPLVFDHVVVAIPWTGQADEGMMVVESPELGRLRIYDATMSDRSAQDVSPRLEGAAALVLHDDTTKLLRLPGTGPEQNVVAKVHNWIFNPDGSLTGNSVFRRYGVPRIGLEGQGGDWLELSELRDRTRESLSEVLPQVQGLEVTEVREEEDGAWSYDASYRADGVLGESQTVRSLGLGELLSHAVIPLPSSEDPESVHYLPILGTIRETFEIRFPGHQLVGGQQPVERTGPVGSARISIEELSDGVQVERELKLSKRQLSAEDRNAVLELRGALREINHKVLLFENVD
jgi:hypothetical protein